ncbi:uncharacterized protein EDB93DRAFT_665308 [Suillus bovinus]|uniref:uncharacterized protein n=1 Tax=Suillus bovinus TaxID=48563 RepID=UPI001B869945|nr:uncharacterized protein EDB93DRAFT_665308 [Suillus bovinus]KAG2158396.1 hypothetical protein EDB93DRAFT_665308 [Suillus bovinus]
MQSTGPQQEAISQSNTAGAGSNPPPAPRVMPVYLPHKPSKPQHERHTSLAMQGAQSGSDTERASLKHRMERNHSGGPVQRGDGYQTNAVRERQGQDTPLGPREDAKSKSEYTSTQGTYHDSRQPLKPTSIHTVDIPLITPGFNSSPLPHESRAHVGTIPVLVAGEGPADRKAHDVLYKSQSPSHKDELHGAGHPHASSLASAVKPSNGRSQSSEVPRSRPEQPQPERSRTDPVAVDLLHGRHHRPEDLTPPRYPQISAPVENQPSQPRSHKTSFSNPPAVSGPRPQRSSSVADHQNEPNRQTSLGPVTSSQPPAHKTNSSPPKIGSGYGSLPSACPTPMSSQAPLVSGTQGNNATVIQQSPPTPAVHSTSMNTSQTMMMASQPSRAPRTSLDRPEPQVVAPRMTTAQISNGSTVKSSWVVQTAQPLKDSYVAREEKHLGSNGSHRQLDPPAVAHPQLREVLSQDPPANRSAPSPNFSLRSSPYGTPKDVYAAGTPRRSPDSSPRMSKDKEVRR